MLNNTNMEPNREEDADGVRDQWLEITKENFDAAVALGDYENAQTAIRVMKDISPSSAKVLEEELLETNVFNFH